MNVSDKETRAVFLNFKELRGLDKNVQALDIEQAYSISLINLDQKLMRVNYKKLKDKVSRIRSHLSNGIIEDLKQLEEDGKLSFEQSASKVDFNIRIEAAAKRLKLQNRAKSAVPRLETGRNTALQSSRAHFIQTPRKTNFQTPRTPSASMSRSTSRVDHAPSGTQTVRPQVNIVIDEVPATNFPVPRSVRAERRQSIDIRCLNDKTSENADKTNPIILNALSNDIRSRTSSFSSVIAEGGVPSSRRASFVHKIPEAKSSSCSVQPKGQESQDEKGGVWSTPSATFLQLPSEGGTCNASKDSSVSVPIPTVQTLAVPGQVSSVNQTSDNKLRPMSVPASKVAQSNNDSDTPKQKRPFTAAQLAVEARRKSVADIQRVSKLLSEGKTRVPFSSHDLKAIEQKSKVVKPFRSIREGTFSVGIDRDVADNTLGDDLHKEMKKGLILGEMATSLVLEDKIDQFLDRVDQYVKENPNYVYDPERTKAELEKIREANKAAKKKKPKRNKLRRRQLQRRLQEENAMAEAAKSRYLRLSDDKIDMSGVNTLVIDQMRMLRKLKCFDEDSD